jgi:hypothetical protein
MVVLALPGVTLEELLSPELTTLPRMVRGSTSAWVAVWREVEDLPDHGRRVVGPTRHDPARPYGVVADYAALVRTVRQELETRAMVWIEPADTERAARYAPLCLPAKAEEHRRFALGQADRLVGELLRDSRIQDVWLLTPPLNPRRRLTPFCWMRRGYGPGLLRSGSTRMTGVVTGPDVAATLARNLGEPYRGDGRPVEVIPRTAVGRAGGPVEELQRLAALSAQTEAVRQVVNSLLKVVLLLLALAAISALRVGRRLPGSVGLAALLLPALLLLEAAVHSGQRLWALSLGALLLGFLAWASARGERTTGGVHAADLPHTLVWQGAAATTAVACLLALLGGDLFRWSVMGYSVPLGVRFYGVGNEFMGWWVGAAVLAMVGGTKPRGWPGSLWLLLGGALIIGHPALGADLGGALTALGAAVVAAGPSLQRRRLLLVGAVVGAAALVAGLAVWDALRPAAQQTHLGQMAVRVAQEGPGPLITMGAGKVATNLRISLGLWGVLLAAGVWLVVEARRRAPESPATAAVSRLLPVAAIAFLVNDSGVIAAALMLSYGVIAATEWRDRPSLMVYPPRAPAASGGDAG